MLMLGQCVRRLQEIQNLKNRLGSHNLSSADASSRNSGTPVLERHRSTHPGIAK